ncbi:MAG: hypothetical protein JSW47_07195 [Phycisphaerales bacterium]|nr:MAG: hypothetical protein JSW47_07195 [Phycisphaerales bacterium]
MAGMVQKRNSGSLIASTVVATATHAGIPLFWLFCSMCIMPRYYAELASMGNDELPEGVRLVFTFSRFMAEHSLVYLFLIGLLLAADGTIHYSLLRVSKAMIARLWSLGIVIAQILLSLYLYLPLRSTAESMAALGS